MSKVLGILGQIAELSAQDLEQLRMAMLDRFSNPNESDGDRVVKRPLPPTLTAAGKVLKP